MGGVGYRKMFASGGTDWWLGSGFYGAFVGGLIAIYSGKKTINNI